MKQRVGAHGQDRAPAIDLEIDHGFDLGFEESGSGSPVVLLHPFPFDRRVWSVTAAALASSYRVISVDARGFGETPLPGPYAIVDLADDLAALLDALDLSQATVVGLSMGGYTALAFAHRHRARVTGLVLADTRATADTPAVREARQDAMALIRSAGATAYLNKSLPTLLSPNAQPTVIDSVRALAETRTASLTAALEALRDRPDRSAELGAITCPTLVVCGADDQVTPVEEMRLLSQSIPGARFVKLDGAGHLANLEAPPAFNQTLVEFLDGMKIR